MHIKRVVFFLIYFFFFSKVNFEMASSSSCVDDEEVKESERGIFFNNDLFEGRADVMSPSLSSSSSSSSSLLHSLMRKRGGICSETCKNCQAQCITLVFNCACTVECALGYFLRLKEVNNFLVVSANFRFVPAYRTTAILPKPAVFDPNKQDRDQFLRWTRKHLYKHDDERRASYFKQLHDNQVSSMQTERGVIQRSA